MPGIPSPKEKPKFRQRLGKENPLQSSYAPLINCFYCGSAPRVAMAGQSAKRKGPDDCNDLDRYTRGQRVVWNNFRPYSGSRRWFGLDGHTAFRSVPSAGPVLVSQHYAPFAGRFAEQTTARTKISNHRGDGVDR
jgi:hypothetical protein